MGDSTTKITATGEWQSTPAFRLRWDVFLNFRGEDTRKIFTQPLHAQLVRNGVRAFIDDEGLIPGDELEPKLPDAIEDSAAAITIISPRYASSRWCLEELAKIWECGRLILPVFYHVNPSDVRRQRGPFKEDFKKLEISGHPNLERWKNSMEKTGGISGWVVEKPSSPDSGDDKNLIQMLVRRILDELSKTPMNVPSYIVGHRYSIEELMRLLNINSKGIQTLGLCGMGGIGKTTLVKSLYNIELVTHFEHRSFISNVRETYEKKPDGLASLQGKIHSDLSLGNEIHEKRVVVVLDDVNDVSLLRELATWWRKRFGEGSRIMITTRDISVLIACHVDDIYHVRELGSSASLELFLYHALRSKRPTKRFLSLAVDIVSLTGGLPLALEVFGSFLFDKRRAEEWEAALQKLKNISPKNLHDVLIVSYDGLDEEEKCMFLDISCLFIDLEMKRGNAIDIFKGCGFKAEISINTLISRSLIRIMENDCLWMHDQIRDMGRQIVHGGERDFGKHSRLWDRDQIFNIMEHDKGTSSIEGIVINFEKKISPIDRTDEYISRGRFPGIPFTTSVIRYLIETYRKCFQFGTKSEEKVILETKLFQSMIRLRLLQLSNVRLKGSFKCIPHALKWLQWRGCPLDSIPLDFCPQLTVLDVSYSKIKSVWDEKWWWWWFSIKVAENLMVMNLHGCYNLTTTPDFSRHPALEKLSLERCAALLTIHKSIGNLTKLRHLNLKDCSNLIEFPNYVTGLKNLETLILSGCSKLKALPQDLRGLNSLKELYIDKTAMEELPNTIFRLTKLELLSLDNCKSLKQLPHCIGKLTALRTLLANGSALEELPDSICELENLETLSLEWCLSLAMLPISIGDLKTLSRFWFSGSSVKELPASFRSLSYLKELSVSRCPNLEKLPTSLGGLASIIELDLDGLPIESLPDCFEGLKSLQKLIIRNCKKLQSLPKSIGCVLTLKTLIVENCAIKELPESIGVLEDLSMLRLMMCTQLCKLPSSFGELKSLHHLYMEKTALPNLPENFGMLSTLITLNMAKMRYDANTKQTVLPSSFSGLSSLQELDASSWKIIGKIPDDFEKLTSLETLNLSYNKFDCLPSSLRGLSVLRKFNLQQCENLKGLPSLPTSLEELNAANCVAIETVSDMSNLENLRDLNLTNCEKLKYLPGLELLSSLRRLYMSGCSSCALVAKNKLGKLALRKLNNLSWPGNKIPDWFTPGEISFSKPKNIVIEAVIVGLIISVNHNQIPEQFRGHLPVVPGVKIKILKSDIPKLTTEPYLAGVPSTDEDHFFLCRYENYHPLVSTLKDGDLIKVEMPDPPIIPGFQLKESGIYLVFENDDDYVTDEGFLPENEQSVSHRLSTFIGESSQTMNSISEF